MRSIRKYKQYILALAFMMIPGATLATPAVAAAAPALPIHYVAANDCSDITPGNAGDRLGKQNGMACIIQRYVNPAVKFMAALAGVAVVISIVVGGIQYASAGGDSGKVNAARERIQKAIIALLAFLFLLAFINWIIPGGINGNGGNT